MARQARDTSKIIDCGKPVIIKFRACALSRHAPAHPYCRALLTRLCHECNTGRPSRPYRKGSGRLMLPQVDGGESGLGRTAAGVRGPNRDGVLCPA
jgi:hypothetical protein